MSVGGGGGGVAKAGAVCSLHENRARSLPDFQHSADRREAVNNDKTNKPLFLTKMRANENNKHFITQLFDVEGWTSSQSSVDAIAKQ